MTIQVSDRVREKTKDAGDPDAGGGVRLARRRSRRGAELPTLVPMRQSEDELREFMGRVIDRLDSIRPWPILPTRRPSGEVSGDATCRVRDRPDRTGQRRGVVPEGGPSGILPDVRTRSVCHAAILRLFSAYFASNRW